MSKESHGKGRERKGQSVRESKIQRQINRQTEGVVSAWRARVVYFKKRLSVIRRKQVRIYAQVCNKIKHTLVQIYKYVT